MKIKVETEQKYYYFNPKKIIEKIKNMKFIEMPSKIENDEYFTDINSEFIENRTCLRIRKTNNKDMEITFKGKSLSLLGQYCKLENNISTDINEYDNFVSLFTSLGFYSYCKVEKERYTFFKTDEKYRYSIMIDTLPSIGGFIEFEIISEQEESKKEELNIALRKFVNSFSEFNLKEETRPYRDVVADYNFKKIKSKEKIENIYICLDEFLFKYEKDFYKKYKEKFSKDYKKTIKWGLFRKNEDLCPIVMSYIDDYLNNVIFDSKELLVAMQLLDKLPQNKLFITKTNKVFFTHFFGKMNIKINNIIYNEDETLNQLIKKNKIDLKNSIIINNKNLKEINSILLVIKNNI